MNRKGRDRGAGWGIRYWWTISQHRDAGGKLMTVCFGDVSLAQQYSRIGQATELFITQQNQT